VPGKIIRTVLLATAGTGSCLLMLAVVRITDRGEGEII